MEARKILPYTLLLVFVTAARFPAASAASGDGKVQLVLYYETLCPYCSNFIVNGLSEVFENGLISIIDLRLVPYGNARIGANNTISCQVNPLLRLLLIRRTINFFSFIQLN